MPMFSLVFAGSAVAACTAPVQPPVVASDPMQALIDTVASQDASVRASTARWLARLEDPVYGAVLSRLSRDPAPSVRGEALLGLAALRSPRRFDVSLLGLFDADTQAEWLAAALQRGLVDQARLESLARGELSDIEIPARVVALRALGDRGVQAQIGWWCEVFDETDSLSHRLEAALNIVAFGSDGALGNAEVESAQRWLMTDEARSPTAVLPAFAAVSSTVPSTQFARLVFTQSPDPDARIASIDLVLRDDARAQGLRKMWSSVCKDLGPTGEPVAAMLALRAAAAAGRAGRPSPNWLTDPRYTPAPDGPLTELGRIWHSERLDIHALTAFLEANGDALSEPVLDWAASVKHPEQAAIALAVLNSDAWADPLSSTRLRAAAMLLASDRSPADGTDSQPVLTGAAVMSIIAATMIDGPVVEPGAHGVPGRAGTDPALDEFLMLALAASGHTGQGGSDPASAEMRDALAAFAESAEPLPIEWRAQAAWLAVVLADEVPELLASMPQPERDMPFVSSHEAGKADTLGQ